MRALADRILVIYEGQIAGEFGPDVTEEELGLAMTGGHAEPDADAASDGMSANEPDAEQIVEGGAEPGEEEALEASLDLARAADRLSAPRRGGRADPDHPDRVPGRAVSSCC